MYTKTKLFFLHALSAVHAGSGSEIGIVDLPVQREKHTGYPKIESSSLKGAIRATVEELSASPGEEAVQDTVAKVFGSPPQDSKEEGESQSGAIALADARLLLFPVKSLRGVFAWVTCKMVLERFNQEASHYISHSPLLPVPPENSVSSTTLLVGNNQLVLEEYSYSVNQDDQVRELAQELQRLLGLPQDTGLVQRLVVLDDNDFADFARMSTEINARIRINPESGIVQEGALWYEENVPPETVFYSFLFAGRERTAEPGGLSDEEVIQFITEEKYFPAVFQLGGNSTLGKGMLRRIWV